MPGPRLPATPGAIRKHRPGRSAAPRGRAAAGGGAGGRCARAGSGSARAAAAPRGYFRSWAGAAAPGLRAALGGKGFGRQRAELERETGGGGDVYC